MSKVFVQVAVASTVVLATGLTAVYLDRSQARQRREAALARLETAVDRAQQQIAKLQATSSAPLAQAGGAALAALAQVAEDLGAVEQKLTSAVTRLAREGSRVEDSGWLGVDVPGARLRRAALRRRAEVLLGEGVRPLQRAQAVLRSIAEVEAAVSAYEAALRGLERDVGAMPAVAAAERVGKRGGGQSGEGPSSSSSSSSSSSLGASTGAGAAAGGAAAGGGDGDDNAKHATTLGYYHFDSTGRKFKNKWDDFDVDAECDRVDQQEALEAVHKRALGLGSKLEKLLTDKVDTLRSADAATVAKRKQLAAHINNVMLARVDRAKERVAKALALEKRQ
jgi:hypothetical protein